MDNIGLTVVSYGGGQETTYFVVRLLEDAEFRAKHIAGDLLIAGSDTGNEHYHTYSNVQKVRDLCDQHNVPFFWITPELGFHSESWQSLTHQYNKNQSVGSARFLQTCTDNLKVKVMDRFVEQYIMDVYDIPGSRKQAYYKFAEKYGKIRLILGFSSEEEKRTSNGSKYDPIWKQKNVERYYPLIVDGTTRQDCIDYLESQMWIVYPSNCMFCFYQSDQEVLWLYRNYPDRFAEWVYIEEQKLEKYKGQEKNFGVFGTGTLVDKLAKAQEKFGHWTDDQLNEYKYSHGHCIKSKY